MNSESMHNDLYCGNFEGAISALEQAFEWLKKPASWDNPHNTRFGKEHIYGSRKRELFAVLSLVQKLRKKIQQKIEKDKDEIECTALTRIDAECIMSCTRQLLQSRDELTTVYRKATMKERPDSITEINRQFETPEERLQQALALVDDMNPLFLMERIFSEVESMRTGIFIHLYPDSISTAKAEQILITEIGKVDTLYQHEYEDQQNAYMDKHFPYEATRDDLAFTDRRIIITTILDKHREAVFNNKRHGERYKSFHRHNLDLFQLIASMYHTEGSGQMLRDIAFVEFCNQELTELNREEEEYNKQQEEERKMLEEACEEVGATDNEANRAALAAQTEPFSERLKRAFELVDQQSQHEIYYLQLSVFACRKAKRDDNPELEGDIIELPSFLTYLSKVTDYVFPSDEKLKALQDNITRFTKPCFKKLEKDPHNYVIGRTELEKYIRQHYSSPLGKCANDAVAKALELYDALGE